MSDKNPPRQPNISHSIPSLGSPDQSTKSQKLEWLYYPVVVRFSIEHKITRNMLAAHLIIYFSLFLFLTVISGGVKDTRDNFDMEVEFEFCGVIVGLCFLYLLLVCMIGCHMVYRSIHTLHSIFRIVVYASVTFMFIVHPVLVWSLARKITIYWTSKMTTRQIFESIFLSLSFIFGEGLIMLSLALKINIPSKYGLAALNRPIEIISHMLNILVMTVVAIRSKSSLRQENSPTDVFMISLYCLWGLQILLAFYMAKRQPFWSRTFSSIYMWGSLSVPILSIFHSLDLIPSMALLVVMPLVFKMTSTTLGIKSKLSPFDPKLSWKEKYYRYILMEKTITRYSKQLPTNSQDLQLYQFYRGLVASRFGIEDISSKEFHNCLIKDLKKLPLNPYTARLLLLLKLTKPIFPISSLPHLLSQVEKSKAAGLMASFDRYHIEKVYEARLQACYRGSVFINTENQYTSIESLYSSIRHPPLSSPILPDSGLDLSQYLHSLKLTSSLFKSLLDHLGAVTNMFSAFSMSSPVPMKKVLSLHKNSIEVMAEMKKAMDQQTNESTSPTLLPLLAFYFGCIKASLAKAELSVKKYVQSQIYTGTVFGTNSIVMKLDMRKERVGEILEASPNIGLYMGYTHDRQPIGKNINDLFPEPLNKKHVELMRTFADYNFIGRPPQDLFINGFDGFLRRIILSVKISPTLSTGPAAFCHLSFQKSPGVSLVLLDPSFTIINSDQQFFNLVEKIQGPLKDSSPGGNGENKKLQTISSQIIEGFDILEAYEQYKYEKKCHQQHLNALKAEKKKAKNGSSSYQPLKPKRSGNDSSQAEPDIFFRNTTMSVGRVSYCDIRQTKIKEYQDNILNLLEEMKLLNETSGIKYQLENFSSLTDMGLKLELIGKHMKTKFNGRKLYKLFVKFCFEESYSEGGLSRDGQDTISIDGKKLKAVVTSSETDSLQAVQAKLQREIKLPSGLPTFYNHNQKIDIAQIENGSQKYFSELLSEVYVNLNSLLRKVQGRRNDQKDLFNTVKDIVAISDVCSEGFSRILKTLLGFKSLKLRKEGEEGPSNDYTGPKKNTDQTSLNSLPSVKKNQRKKNRVLSNIDGLQTHHRLKEPVISSQNEIQVIKLNPQAKKILETVSPYQVKVGGNLQSVDSLDNQPQQKTTLGSVVRLGDSALDKRSADTMKLAKASPVSSASLLRELDAQNNQLGHELETQHHHKNSEVSGDNNRPDAPVKHRKKSSKYQSLVKGFVPDAKVVNSIMRRMEVAFA